ncbi:MAG TPA: gliding motility-associated C-terminal domain-containing protein, partial [Chitinophagales bacterium]|nr:gliding motility-associated C-terminal domain-containing protein [Chitinophagales bacterium]
GFTFANWTLLHHTLAPNNTAASASFTITQDDTLVANFNAIPNPDTFNLTVLINPTGGGNVAVNGTTPATYPAVLQFVDGSPVNLVATQNGGFSFASYTLLHHTLIPNNTTANAAFNITQDDTLVANFDAIINPDTFNLTVLVNPAGGGNVAVNGTTPGSYPAVLQFVDGSPINLVATQNGGFSFASYTLLHHTLTPNNTNVNAGFTITQDDTLVANFDAVINPDTFELTVLINPAAGGNVTVNGTNYSPYPVTLQFVENTAISATVTTNPGYTFSNWTLLHHTLAPNNTAATVGFTITQNDTLTAEFTVNPPDSFDIVVDIEPNRLAGKVITAGVTPTTYPYRARYAQGTNVDFEAIGQVLVSSAQTHNYIFDHYDFIYHSPIPNVNEPIVFINVQQPDTVIAYFIDEPAPVDSSLQVWIPSAFNPDGVNNVFRVHPRSELLADFNMQIYNRWGQKVFESNNQNYGWSGLHNNQPAPLAVYSYVVIGKRMNGEDVVLRGTVTLIR